MISSVLRVFSICSICLVLRYYFLLWGCLVFYRLFIRIIAYFFLFEETLHKYNAVERAPPGMPVGDRARWRARRRPGCGMGEGDKATGYSLEENARRLLRESFFKAASRLSVATYYAMACCSKRKEIWPRREKQRWYPDRKEVFA